MLASFSQFGRHIAEVNIDMIFSIMRNMKSCIIILPHNNNLKESK
jgi:hypothetical protein